MTTSWNDLPALDNYLRGTLPKSERLLLEARLINESRLRGDLQYLRKTIRLVQDHGRATVRKELEAIHGSLFSDPEKKIFQQRIINLFHT